MCMAFMQEEGAYKMHKTVVLILVNGTHIKPIFLTGNTEIRNHEICMRKNKKLMRTDEVVYVTYSADLR